MDIFIPSASEVTYSLSFFGESPEMSPPGTFQSKLANNSYIYIQCISMHRYVREIIIIIAVTVYHHLVKTTIINHPGVNSTSPGNLYMSVCACLNLSLAVSF